MTNLDDLRSVHSTLSRAGSLLNEAADEIQQLRGALATVGQAIAELSKRVETVEADMAKLRGEKPPVDPPVEPVPDPVEPPLPPDQPVERVPDIRIELAGIGAWNLGTHGRDAGPGERWASERRWTWKPWVGDGPLLHVVTDLHDSGQVRINFDRADWRTPVAPNAPLVLDVTVDIDGQRRHHGPIRVHHHTRPSLVFGERVKPSTLRIRVPPTASGTLPRYESLIVPESDLAAIAAGKYPWESWSAQAKTKGIAYDPVSEQYVSVLRSFTGGAGPLLNEAAMLMPVQIAYLLSRDPRAWAEVVRLADSSGNYAIHYRLPDGRYPLPHETGDMPQLNTDPPVTLTTASGVRLPIPDVAHQHSLCYLAYLLTGERYYYEELQAWAGYNLLFRPKGPNRSKGLLSSGELRATAWALRSLLHLVLATDPVKQSDLRTTYEAQLRFNLNWLNDRFARPGAPDYRPTGITHFAPWRSMAMLQFVRAEPKPQWTPTWQHHVLAYVLGECVRAGFDEAAPARDHLLRVAEGCWRYSPSKHLAAWGNHAVPVTVDGEFPAAEWAPLMATTFAGMPASSPHRTAFTEPLTPDYLAWFRAAVVAAVDARQPWATEALQWLDKAIGEFRWKSVPIVWRVMPQ